MTREEAAKELQSYADSSWGGLNEAFEMAIAALMEPQWISVKDRLPEDNVQVLACTKHGKAFSAHCENGKWRVSGSVKVTHWMPLPEPPEVAQYREETKK